jgi:hypothetical protein
MDAFASQSNQPTTISYLSFATIVDASALHITCVIGVEVKYVYEKNKMQ